MQRAKLYCLAKIVCVLTLTTLALTLTTRALADAEAAQPEWDHHERLEVDTALTLREVLQLTLERHPRRGTIAARQDQTRTWKRYARSWLSDTPMLGLRYQTDRLNDNDGLEEWESGIELPLWRWGQRSRVREYGTDLAELTEASQLALRWELAGELRQQLWSIGLADTRVRLAREQLAADSELLELVEKQVISGDRPRSELLLAQSRQLQASSELLDAEAMLVDEERRYQSLTGLLERPDFAPEVQSPRTHVPPDHPMLQLANARVAETEAFVQISADSAISSPTLTVGPRREKAVADDGFDDSIGLTLQVPLGGSRYQAVSSSAARLAAAEAKSTRDQQLRLLQLDFHDAHHELEVTRNQLELARTNLDFCSQQVRMAQIGHEQGEYNLTDLLRERSRYQAAVSRVRQLEMTENLLIAMYNQAVGVLP